MTTAIKALLIMLVLPYVAFSQTNYREGYVIKSNGDSIRGYLAYSDLKSTPNTISFKKTTTDSPGETYSAADLKAFQANGAEKFISYTGEISTNKLDVPLIPDSLDMSAKKVTTFLKLVYQGTKVSLLSAKDSSRLNLFTMESGTRPAELKYYKYYKADGYNIHYIYTYKGQLNLLAEKYNPGNSRIANRMERLDFDEFDITQVIKLINRDNNIEKGGTLTWFAGVLLSQTGTKFVGENDFTTAGTSNSFFPKASVGFDYQSKYTSKRLTFRAELTYSRIKPNFNINTIGSSTPNYESNYHFTQSTISFSPQVLINFVAKPDLKVFAGLGVSFNFSSYSDQLLSRYSPSPPLKLEKYWLGFPLQAGVAVFNRFDVYALCEFGSSYADYQNFSILNTTYGIGVHYYLSKKNK